MEFTTEVYLNDLLTNTEVNGFESAKESFYECINTNDDIAMEGRILDAYNYNVLGGVWSAGMNLGEKIVGDSDASKARQVVGAVAVIPVGILLYAVMAVLSLIGLIVKLIDAIVVLISRLINRKIEKAIFKFGDLNDELRYFGEHEGLRYAKSICGFASVIVPAIRALGPICNHLNDKNNGIQTKPMGINVSKIEEIKSKCETAYEDAKNARDLYNALFDDMVKRNIDDPNEVEHIRYSLCLINAASIQKMTAYVKDISPKLQEYKKILNIYEANLNKTKTVCAKAKAAGNKEIDPSKLSATANDEVVKCLKSMQSIIKFAGEFVKMASEITISHQNLNKDS